MGTAETLSAKWARLLEHEVTVCKSCTSAGHCGSLGLFQLPDSAAIAERTSAASLLCYAPSKNSEVSKRESSCFDTGGAVFFPATSPSVQLGSKQTLYRRVKALQKPNQGNKSKLHWKDRFTNVILDRKFHEAYQAHTEKSLGFQAIGPMVPFLPLCLKMYIACDLAVAFALGIDEIHVYTQFEFFFHLSSPLDAFKRRWPSQ